MNQQAKRQSGEADTAVLSLEEFVRSQSSSTRSVDDSPTEWPTMFFAKAATEVCSQNSKPIVNPKDTGPLPPASILGIVSYCYAKGVYAAEDIERKLLKNPQVRAACGNEVPRASVIRRFRRLNREAILSLLERFFRRTRKRSMPTAPRASESEAASPTPGASSPDADNTQVLARNEAVSRLEKAAFIDGMSG
jgi:hypothetical protein